MITNNKYILTALLTLAISLCAYSPVRAQIKAVHGTVTDEYGELMGASVCEVDANGRIIEATTTDLNGNFSMRIRNPKDKLRFSYVGCKTQTLTINREDYRIKLVSQTSLKEVTVTAKKKLNGGGLAIPEREISYATQTIDMKEFEGLGLTTVDEALQGRIAGLDIVANSGNLGAGTTMRLRGASSISTLTNSNPLIVVNGNTWNVDMNNFDVTNANDEQFAQLLNVNPEDIASITVLKDAAATAIYGSQGANGVIEITTKRGARGTRVENPRGFPVGRHVRVLRDERLFLVLRGEGRDRGDRPRRRYVGDGRADGLARRGSVRVPVQGLRAHAKRHRAHGRH